MNNQSTNRSQRCSASQIGRVGNLRDIAVPQGSVSTLSNTKYRWNIKLMISRQRNAQSIFPRKRPEMSPLGTFVQNFSQIEPKLGVAGENCYTHIYILWHPFCIATPIAGRMGAFLATLERHPTGLQKAFSWLPSFIFIEKRPPWNVHFDIIGNLWLER